MNKERRALASDQEEQAHTIDIPIILAPDELLDNKSFIKDIIFAYPAVGTVEDVAELLRIPAVSVRALCRMGQLEAFKIGKLWRIPRASLVSFIKERGY